MINKNKTRNALVSKRVTSDNIQNAVVGAKYYLLELTGVAPAGFGRVGISNQNSNVNYTKSYNLNWLKLNQYSRWSAVTRLVLKQLTGGIERLDLDWRREIQWAQLAVSSLQVGSSEAGSYNCRSDGTRSSRENGITISLQLPSHLSSSSLLSPVQGRQSNEFVCLTCTIIIHNKWAFFCVYPSSTVRR